MREKMRGVSLPPFPLSFGFAFVVTSLSFTLSSSRPTHLPPWKKPSPFFSRSSLSTVPTKSDDPIKVATDLVLLLGTKEEASRVDPIEAKDLRSCVRFLVPQPSSPVSEHSYKSPGRVLLERTESEKNRSSDCVRRIDDELVWWPPEPVMELARLAVDSGGDPAAIQRALDPTIIQVPDVEGCKNDKCELTRTTYGRRFINKELNSYMAFLFETIMVHGPSVGLNVTLSRYDLFHGHLFLATNSGRLGILFHAKEYPAYEKNTFPYNMGYCQHGSNVKYDDLINLRNILWLAPLPSNNPKASPQWVAPGVLVVLDAYPGGIIYRDLVPYYVNDVRTIYEDDFGDVVVDVNYLNVENVSSEERIFIC